MKAHLQAEKRIKKLMRVLTSQVKKEEDIKNKIQKKTFVKIMLWT